MKEVAIIKFTETDSTVTLLRSCLDATPERGFDRATLKARARVDAVLDALKPEDGIIKMEDADYATAVQATAAVRWVKREKYYNTFHDQFA